MKIVLSWAGGLVAELRRVGLTTQILVERRAVLLVTVDLLILLFFLVATLVEGGEPGPLYIAVVLVPFLLLGVPVLSNSVAVERRAGSLDLALSSPGGHLYFLRRVACFGGLMLAQGWLVVWVIWLLTERRFSLPMLLVQAGLLTAYIVAVVLFWAVRLRGTGAVAVASLVTILLLWRWIGNVPFPTCVEGVQGCWLAPAEMAAPWVKANLAVALATIIFYLYARRRMRRPEGMLR